MQLSIEEFIARSQDLPVFDVRTPDEFAQGHFPGAHNLPIFSNDERAVIGTTYKQRGRHAAIKEGLDLVGPKMRGFVEAVEALVGPPDEAKPVLVHCWRGGMRSGSMSWLLEFYGYEVDTLDGGYKAYRNWALDSFEIDRDIVILGGYTGSGKTLMLYELERMGAQIIDLEGLANHKGSSFGALGMPEQPTTQQFENELAWVLHTTDPNRPLWVEDESRMVGRCAIPHEFWKRMKRAPVVAVDVPTQRRVDLLVDAYGEADPEELSAAFERISKRLGGRDTTRAREAVARGDLAEAAEIGLCYYDKAYEYGLSKRADGQTLDVSIAEGMTAAEAAAHVLEAWRAWEGWQAPPRQDS